MAKKKRGSTERIEILIELLRKRGASNRTGEWFTQEMLPDITEIESAAKEAIITRRALAFKAMLKAMTSPENSKFTHTYEIKQGELIVGTMPMGSLGFGKVFPNYLTEKEKEVAFRFPRRREDRFEKIRGSPEAQSFRYLPFRRTHTLS